MSKLETIEVKAFLPAKDFEESKQFYQDLGFTLKSSDEGIAYFCHDNSSFLLQDFYTPELAGNLMMHLLVIDVEAWWAHCHQQNLPQRYDVTLGNIKQQAWGMREFTLTDPSGVLWRIAKNIEV